MRDRDARLVTHFGSFGEPMQGVPAANHDDLRFLSHRGMLLSVTTVSFRTSYPMKKLVGNLSSVVAKQMFAGPE